MNRIKKIIFCSFACFLAISILLIAGGLVIQKMINTEAVGDRVKGRFSEILGAEIEFKRVGLSLFPSPHVSLYQSSLVLHTRLTASADAITVYPEILSLLSLKLNIKELLVQELDLSIVLEEMLEKKDVSEKPLTIGNLAQEINAIVMSLPVYKIPNIESHLRGGRIKLIYGKKQILEFRHIEGRLTVVPNRLEFQVAGSSDISKAASVSGWMNTRQMKSDMRMVLTELRPQAIYNTLIPKAAINIEDARVDLTIHLNLNGSAQLEADIDALTPELKLAHENETIAIQSLVLKGNIHIDQNSAYVSLTELVLDDPKMRLSGNLILSLDNSQARMQLDGLNIDVKSTRHAALAIFKKHGVIHDIFKFVKAGVVPSIRLEVQGGSLRDLVNMDNLVIQGQMKNCDIQIPDVSLNLAETSGDILISQGILEGKNIEARLGRSSIRNGIMKIGLGMDVAPFHLETDIQADLSELPPILKRLIGHKRFQKELAVIKEVKGNANVKLVLGEDRKNVQVKVEASDVHLSARYREIPHPIEITGGNITYDKNRICLRNISGTLGKSSFSKLAGSLDFHKKYDLTIRSGESSLFLSEIVPWLASSDNFRELDTYYGGGNSIITVSTIDVKGPLFSPENLQFKVAGTVEDLVVKNLPQHLGPVTIASGTFNLNPQTLTYTDTHMTMLDGTLKISGSHSRYLEGFKNGRLNVEGRMGPKFTYWISEVLHLPTWIKLQPVFLSPSQLRWKTSGKTAVSGNLALQEGTNISLDVLTGSDELVIEKLHIQDAASRAEIKYSHKEKMLDLSFNGNLHKSTLDKVIQDNALLTGWIDGSIRARINRKDTFNSSFIGKLEGSALSVPLPGRGQLKIGSFSVTGGDHNLFVKSADLVWMDLLLSLSGNIKFGSQDKLWIDMDMAADTIDLDHLMQAFKKEIENKKQKPHTDSLSLPVHGMIRFKTDRFKFDRFTWSPLQTEIRINNVSADVNIKEAVICSISTPGRLKISPQVFEFDLEPTGEGKNLNSFLNCFAAEIIKADGKYSLNGNLRGHGKVSDLLKTSEGHLELFIEDGRIYHDFVLLKVIKYLSVLKVLTGTISVQQMEKEGFGYRSLQAEAVMQDGKILYKKVVLDGDLMTIIAHGEHDLLNGQLDIAMLVAPLKILDRLVRNVPLVGGVLGTLNAIPIRVKGTLNDIKVLPLDPSFVAYELKALLENMVNTTINLVPAEKYFGNKSNGKP